MVVDFASEVFIPLGQAGADAFDDTRSWVDPRGHRLSDRLWLARQADRDAIDSILRESVARGDDPIAAARRLEDYLTPGNQPIRHPESGRLVRTAKRDRFGNVMRDAQGRMIYDQPAGVLTRTPRGGMGSYAARRLARTEVTRAFGQATLQAAALNPFVEGVKWNLSGSHHKPDECDSKARGSSRGMEPGVYTVRDAPRYPTHPNCRCYLSPWTVKDTDAVVAQLRRDIAREQEPVSTPFSPAMTLKEAEAFARRLGVQDVVYGEPGKRLKAEVTERLLRAANVTNDGLSRLAARGVPLPPKVRVMRDPYHTNAAAYYAPQKQELTVNSLNSVWRNPEREALDMHEKGWWVSPDPADLIVHEVGHFRHLGAGLDPDTMSMAKQALPQQYLPTAESVSRYAATTMSEFVAETWTALFRGQRVSDEVMTLYRQFKGPVLP